MKPSLTSTSHLLPYNQLSPRDFERLCLWLVEREGFERAEHLGAAGGEQGRDLRAWREGQPVVFQCKRVKSFGPQDALKEVDKLLGLPEGERPARLVFLVTCDVSVQARDAACQRAAPHMACEFWASTEFDARVKRYPEIVREFFHLPGGETEGARPGWAPPPPPAEGTLPEPGGLPPGSWLPFLRNEYFTGREADLLALGQALVHGLQGVVGTVQKAVAAAGIRRRMPGRQWK